MPSITAKKKFCCEKIIKLSHDDYKYILTVCVNAERDLAREKEEMREKFISAIKSDADGTRIYMERLEDDIVDMLYNFIYNKVAVA